MRKFKLRMFFNFHKEAYGRTRGFFMFLQSGMTIILSFSVVRRLILQWFLRKNCLLKATFRRHPTFLRLTFTSGNYWRFIEAVFSNLISWSFSFSKKSFSFWLLGDHVLWSKWSSSNLILLSYCVNIKSRSLYLVICWWWDWRLRERFA